MNVPFFRRPFKNRSFYNFSVALIFANIAVYAIIHLAPLFYGEEFALRLKFMFSLSPAGIFGYKMLWQPVTYMFVHGGILHLFFNMLALFFFGPAVEHRLGSKEFILIYFFCGIFSGLVSLGIYYLSGRLLFVLMGASGAIYGILLAFAVCFPRAQIFIFWIIPVPAPVMVVVFALLETLGMLGGSSGIAHYAHLAGFAGAWLYFVVRMGISPVRIWKNNCR